MTFKVPQLNYQTDALQPAVSQQIMELHHGTHHVTYVTKLNEALAAADIEVDFDEADEMQAVASLLTTLDQLPEPTRTAVRNNGGGHYNHSMFWLCMTPGGNPISESLEADLTEKYGSFEAFKEEFTAKALSVFGSGWVWLQPNLEILTSPNQYSPIMNGGPAPILGLDVWEHAYYLDYQAGRKNYVDAWWGVVDWSYVQDRLDGKA